MSFEKFHNINIEIVRGGVLMNKKNVEHHVLLLLENEATEMLENYDYAKRPMYNKKEVIGFDWENVCVANDILKEANLDKIYSFVLDTSNKVYFQINMNNFFETIVKE